MEVSHEVLRNAIRKHARSGQAVAVGALMKSLESELGLSKGALKGRKDEIKRIVTEEIDASDSESDEEIIAPRKGTVVAEKAAEEPVSRARAGTAAAPVSSDPVAIDDEDNTDSDKTAGKSRAGQAPDFAGFLKKRGDQGRFKLWRKRHFRLYKKEGIVAYFKSETETVQLGEISVNGAFLIEKRPDLGQWVFTITMKTTARVWILQAADEATQNQWITNCSPLLKEQAAVLQPSGAPGQPAKKPPKPAPGLPLPFPPKYVQGFSEREQCFSHLQSGANDWTNLTNTPVTPVTLRPGLVALTIDASGDATVEEVREIALDRERQGVVTDLPKQLKYAAETVAWTSGDSQLLQARFVAEEKTQRELLRKLAGMKVEVSVPGTGAGQAEDCGKRQDTRLVPDDHAHAHAGGLGLVFPPESKFSGTLFYDGNDERYALVNESSNEVHFLNTRDARTVKLQSGSVSQFLFQGPQLIGRFAGRADKTVGQLTYALKDAFELHTNYAIVLGQDEKSADVQGWFSINNMTSKTYRDATLVAVPGKAPEKSTKTDAKKTKEEEVAEVAEDEAKKEATKKGFGGALSIAGALFKKEEVVEEPRPEKKYTYPITQSVTLPAYDWAHVAFADHHVPVRTQHLVTFATPAYTIKPQVAREAGTEASAGNAFTVVRFANPTGAAIPGGFAEVRRRERGGLGVTRVGTSSVPRVEAGETVTVEVEKLWGVQATRKQTGYNFDSEKHFIIEQIEILVVNTRNETVDVTIEDSMFRWSQWEISAAKPAPVTGTHPRRIAWDLRLNHGEDITIKYTSFYSNFSLDSDFEQPNAPASGGFF